MKANWPPRKGNLYHWVSYAVAHKQWKLLASENFEHIELYDIVADPLEKKDLKVLQGETGVMAMQVEMVGTEGMAMQVEMVGNCVQSFVDEFQLLDFIISCFEFS